MTVAEQDRFYRAMVARDARFDGKFFVGVKTTGVYCRPICPARPARRNVEFFPRAAAAERAGYRPCLRCRPECAPESPGWVGTSAVVRRGLKLIAAGELGGGGGGGAGAFARQLGVTPRHLRRLFVAEVGQTPKRIADQGRLDFARKLVVETRLPMSRVAHTAGFASLRRFNAAFKGRFRRPPMALRRGRGRGEANSGGVELSLAYRPPLDWQAVLDFYRSHAMPGVEWVDGAGYERVFCVSGVVGFLRVEPAGEARLKLRVVTGDAGVLCEVVRRVRRMFDLDADPVLVANALGADAVLGRLVKKRPGLRIARGFDGFESSVCTVLGQLVSMSRARALVGELVAAYGERVAVGGREGFVFPNAMTLAGSDLGAVKTTGVRRGTIRELARRVADGTLSLSDAQDPQAFRAALREIPGVGSWTAEYVSLRGIGDADAFPGTDLVLARAVAAHPGMDLEGVRPWRGYAAVHLWREFAGMIAKKEEVGS